MKTMKLIADIFEMLGLTFMSAGAVMMYVALNALIKVDELGMQYFNITAYATIAILVIGVVLIVARAIMVMIDGSIAYEED